MVEKCFVAFPGRAMASWQTSWGVGNECSTSFFSMASQLWDVFVVPTDPAILRNWSFPKGQLSQKKNLRLQYDNEKHHTQVLVKIFQEIVVVSSDIFFWWNSPGNLIFSKLSDQQLLAEMLQFDGLGFLFQGANLKIHTDGTNVTLLEGAKGWIPGRWGEIAHPKVWEKTERGEGS